LSTAASGASTRARPHQTQEEPDEVPGILPLPAQSQPTQGPHRDRARQFLPTPDHEEGHPGRRLGAANNVEFACTPTNIFWPNRIEAQFTALRYVALDSTNHATHKEQAA
jgi:hypothetical protein